MASFSLQPDRIIPALPASGSGRCEDRISLCGNSFHILNQLLGRRINAVRRLYRPFFRYPHSVCSNGSSINYCINRHYTAWIQIVPFSAVTVFKPASFHGSCAVHMIPLALYLLPARCHITVIVQIIILSLILNPFIVGKLIRPPLILPLVIYIFPCTRISRNCQSCAQYNGHCHYSKTSLHTASPFQKDSTDYNTGALPG